MESLAEVIRLAIDNYLSNVHTSLPAKITQVNETTINVKPVINRLVKGKSVELPEFVNVPPIFIQGGSSYIAHPLTVGDSCLLIVTENCFDNWYNGEDNLEPRESRTFDYSDSFAIVGINPFAKAIKIPQKTTMQGDVIQKGNYTHTGNREQTGDYTLNGNLTATGDGTFTGNVTKNCR